MPQTETILKYKGTFHSGLLEDYEVVVSVESEEMERIVGLFGSAKARYRACRVLEGKKGLWAIHTGASKPRMFLIVRGRIDRWPLPDKGKIAVVGPAVDRTLVPSSKGLEVDFFTNAEA